MDYNTWSYENLLNLRSQLEECSQSGQPFQQTLYEVTKEIAERRFALVAILGGRARKEYGRWKTPDECREAANRMGLPVGGNFELQGQKFEMTVIEFDRN